MTACRMIRNHSTASSGHSAPAASDCMQNSRESQYYEFLEFLGRGSSWVLTHASKCTGDARAGRRSAMCMIPLRHIRYIFACMRPCVAHRAYRYAEHFESIYNSDMYRSSWEKRPNAGTTSHKARSQFWIAILDSGQLFILAQAERSVNLGTSSFNIHTLSRDSNV